MFSSFFAQVLPPILKDGEFESQINKTGGSSVYKNDQRRSYH